jgi:hypothetical protein
LTIIFIVAKDRLHYRLVDGVRHELKKRYGEKIREKIAKKRAADQNSDDPAPKKMKPAYIVIKCQPPPQRRRWPWSSVKRTWAQKTRAELCSARSCKFFFFKVIFGALNLFIQDRRCKF